MPQVLLTELYRTKYFYRTMVTDLNYLFSSMVTLIKDPSYKPNVGNEQLGEVYDWVRSGEEVILDLAGAHLTTDACTSINMAQHNGIKFCDSSNSGRNAVLLENRKRLSLDITDFVKLPEYTYRTDLKSYIKSLDPNTKYIVTGMSEKVMIALTCLITIMRPSITLDIDLIASKLFKFIATKVSVQTLMDDTEFFYVTDEGIDKAQGDSIYVQQLDEYVSAREAVKYGILIPSKFGTKVLLEELEWRPLFKACLNILEDYQAGCPKQLSEIYGVSVW